MSSRYLKQMYWIMPLIIGVFQWQFAMKSAAQISFEALNEGVRNVFWLDNGLVYDGISRNVAWYATLLGLYRTVGFSLTTAVFFRWAVSLVSMYVIAMLLKLFHVRYPIVPLVAIGLSPVLLYLTTFSSTYGLDFQYIPLWIGLLWLFKSSWWRPTFLMALLGGMFVGISLLSYPVFYLYMPAVLLWLILTETKLMTRMLSVGVILGIGSVFILSFLSIDNRVLLIKDRNVNSSIIPRINTVQLTTVTNNWRQLIRDYTVTGNSYHFVLPKPDLSDGLPLLSLLVMIIAAVRLWWREESQRPIIASIMLTILLTALLVVTLIPEQGLVGGRKATPILLGMYGLFILSWKYLLEQKPSKLRSVVVLLLLLLPLHHVLVLPENLHSVGKYTYYSYDSWIDRSMALTPNIALAEWVSKTEQAEVTLACNGYGVNEVRRCRYAEIYAAIAGYCVWNKRDCHTIYGYDDRIGRKVLLTPDLWNQYYFSH